MADAPDSKSGGVTPVWVQVPPSVLKARPCGRVFFFCPSRICEVSPDHLAGPRFRRWGYRNLPRPLSRDPRARIDFQGYKNVLGIREAATKKAEVAKSLLEDLVAPGLGPKRRRLFAVEGSKALRRAIDQEFGDGDAGATRTQPQAAQRARGLSQRPKRLGQINAQGRGQHLRARKEVADGAISRVVGRREAESGGSTERTI